MIDLIKIKKVVNVFSLTGKYLRLAERPEADVINLKNNWAKDVVNHFNISVQIKGNPINKDESFILVGNHISYLDIPILLYSCPEISFVSKKEVKSWPVIGNAATKAETIFVERNNSSSRNSAKIQITNSLLENKKKIAIFPSGTTSIRNSSFWKKGVFEIAEKNDIKVQPFRIRYEPLGPASYVGNDNFLQHMYQLFRLKKIFVSLEFHEPVSIKNSIDDCDYWKKWCEE